MTGVPRALSAVAMALALAACGSSSTPKKAAPTSSGPTAGAPTSSGSTLSGPPAPTSSGAPSTAAAASGSLSALAQSYLDIAAPVNASLAKLKGAASDAEATAAAKSLAALIRTADGRLAALHADGQLKTDLDTLVTTSSTFADDLDTLATVPQTTLTADSDAINRATTAVRADLGLPPAADS